MIDTITLTAFSRGLIPMNEFTFVVSAVISMKDVRKSWPHLLSILEDRGILLDRRGMRHHSFPLIVCPFEQKNDLENDVIIIKQWQTLYTRALYGRKKAEHDS